MSLLHPAVFHNTHYSCQSKLLWKYGFVSSNYLLNHLLNSIISSTSVSVCMPKYMKKIIVKLGSCSSLLHFRLNSETKGTELMLLYNLSAPPTTTHRELFKAGRKMIFTLSQLPTNLKIFSISLSSFQFSKFKDSLHLVLIFQLWNLRSQMSDVLKYFL